MPDSVSVSADGGGDSFRDFNVMSDVIPGAFQQADAYRFFSTWREADVEHVFHFDACDFVYKISVSDGVVLYGECFVDVRFDSFCWDVLQADWCVGVSPSSFEDFCIAVSDADGIKGCLPDDLVPASGAGEECVPDVIQDCLVVFVALEAPSSCEHEEEVCVKSRPNDASVSIDCTVFLQDFLSSEVSLV